MSIRVTDFKWEKEINDARYIELLEKTLKNEQKVTALAMAKVRQLAKENQEIRNAIIDEFMERMKEKWIESDDLSISSEFFDFVDEIAEKMRGVE